jgi:hypothetical protein
MPLVRPLAAAGLVTALLAGCGGPSSMIAGKSPQDIVKVSSQRVLQQSLRADISGRLIVDGSHLTGATPAQLQQFGVTPNGHTFTGHEEQESIKRLRLIVTLPPDYSNATVVVYDGSTYYSKDGTRFAPAGQLSGLTAGIGVTPGDLGADLGYLGSTAKDLGSTTQDGMTVEHLQAPIDQSALDRVLSSSVGSGSNLSGYPDIFRQFIEVQSGTLDMYVVPETANLDRVAMTLRFSFDFSKIATLFGGAATPARKGTPAGTLDFDVAVNAHLYDYGARITVTKPTVDPTAPRPPSGGLIGGLGT